MKKYADLVRVVEENSGWKVESKETLAYLYFILVIEVSERKNGLLSCPLKQFPHIPYLSKFNDISPIISTDVDDILSLLVLISRLQTLDCDWWYLFLKTVMLCKNIIFLVVNDEYLWNI